MKSPVNLFDLAYLAVFPPAAATVMYKMRKHGKYRESAPALLGRQLDGDAQNPVFDNGCVWVHAVSVGEVIAAKAILPHLKKRFAPLPILLTTHTETGQATARSLPEGFADVVRYLPLDFSWLMRRAVKTWKPRVFIPMETELWPNMLNAISQSDAKIFTINGKISERSFKSYNRIRPLIQPPLSRVTAFCVQTPGDAQRIGHLLGRTDHIHVTGNCKFDVEIPQLDDNGKAILAAELGLPWPAKIIVAGSTHPGEEEIVLQAMENVWDKRPEVHLVVVPRHPERFDEAWNLLQKHSGGVRRVSETSASHSVSTDSFSPRVHLVDKMGVLTRLYALADIAIVAGSLVPGIGGHNLLEPAAHGVPVVYGPYMKSQPDMVRIMESASAGTQVVFGNEPDGSDTNQTAAAALGRELLQLLNNSTLARQKGEAGLQAYRSNRGAAERCMEVLDKYL